MPQNAVQLFSQVVSRPARDNFRLLRMDAERQERMGPQRRLEAKAYFAGAFSASSAGVLRGQSALTQRKPTLM